MYVEHDDFVGFENSEKFALLNLSKSDILVLMAKRKFRILKLSDISQEIWKIGDYLIGDI